MDVIEVVLVAAVTRPARGSRVANSHALTPTVVCADGLGVSHERTPRASNSQPGRYLRWHRSFGGTIGRLVECCSQHPSSCRSVRRSSHRLPAHLAQDSQLGGAICMRPASPPPPVTPGLQVDSCMAKEANIMG